MSSAETTQSAKGEIVGKKNEKVKKKARSGENRLSADF